MNILQLVNKVPFPPIDGGSIATLNMSDFFSWPDNKLTMLAMNTSKHYINPEELATYQKENFSIEWVDIDTELNSFSAFTNLLFSKLP